jgi:hypothetical protein
MTTQSTFEGRTIYLIPLDGCGSCIGIPSGSPICEGLPDCHSGGNMFNDSWVYEQRFVQWVAEERMK